MVFFHDRKRNRLQGYDYSSFGYYFVTICAKERYKFFGEVVHGTMILNKIGQIAHREWMQTARLRKNVRLDSFVVMPNHVHGILQIISCNGMVCFGRGARPRAPTDKTNHTRAYGKLPAHSLGAIINNYKSAVTKWCNENGHGHFHWQRNYHDHIIRDETALQKIREYIAMNPAKWDIDRNNLKNCWK